MEVLFVAAVNGAIEGGKVGCIGDVIRDLPQRVYQPQPGIPRRAAVAGQCIVPGSLFS